MEPNFIFLSGTTSESNYRAATFLIEKKKLSLENNVSFSRYAGGGRLEWDSQSVAKTLTEFRLLRTKFKPEKFRFRNAHETIIRTRGTYDFPSCNVAVLTGVRDFHLRRFSAVCWVSADHQKLEVAGAARKLFWPMKVLALLIGLSFLINRQYRFGLFR